MSEMMGAYKIEQLGEKLWVFDTADMDACIYVLEGETMAAVIDTGMAEEDIVPVVEHLTKLPYVLMLTHSHVDHVKFAANFEKKYICSREFPFLADATAMPGIPAEVADTTAYTPFEAGDVMDLGGGVCLEAIPMYGHTLGSMGFYCEKYHVLFCGDAFGSGAGVWMQVPQATTVAEYQKNLEKFLTWARAAQEEHPFEMLVGHRAQRYGFPGHPQDNPMTLELVEDMITLCQKVLDGEFVGEQTRVHENDAGPMPYSVEYGRAGMIYRPERLR